MKDILAGICLIGIVAAFGALLGAFGAIDCNAISEKTGFIIAGVSLAVFALAIWGASKLNKEDGGMYGGL